MPTLPDTLTHKVGVPSHGESFIRSPSVTTHTVRFAGPYDLSVLNAGCLAINSEGTRAYGIKTGLQEPAI